MPSEQKFSVPSHQTKGGQEPMSLPQFQEEEMMPSLDCAPSRASVKVLTSIIPTASCNRSFLSLERALQSRMKRVS